MRMCRIALSRRYAASTLRIFQRIFRSYLCIFRFFICFSYFRICWAYFKIKLTLVWIVEIFNFFIWILIVFYLSYNPIFFNLNYIKLFKFYLEIIIFFTNILLRWSMQSESEAKSKSTHVPRHSRMSINVAIKRICHLS